MAVWAAFTLAFACLLAAAHATTLGVVYTEGGFVQGTNKKIGLLLPEYVDIFKGIPFAAQPKILQKAERHPGWSGTLKATDYKPRCLQLTIDQSNTMGSEDCMYLNIWVPHTRSGVSTNLPVMIWIYGGAFLLGGGQGANFLDNYLYDGQEIALRGKAIVVTFNYRVGPLGFLSTGDASAPGNYGLWDQHMAIAWVKRNIAGFGGDPNNITIFGESAGAASVSLQTLTPYNVGLVKRAISQSGVGLCPWAIQRDPLVWAKQVASKVGCPVDDTAALANCLRVTDPRAVTLAFKIALVNQPYPLVHYLAFSPVIDGDFIPDEPRNLFGNAADVDYLAGVNNMDGHLFAGMDQPLINQPLSKISQEQVRALVQGLTLPKGSSGLDIAFDLYTEGWGANPDQETMKKTVVEAETDYIFLVPTQEALALHRQNANSGKTYSYLFSHPSRMPVYPSWVGADHADDLQYIFGKPFTTPLAYRSQDRDVSATLIAYWTNFAKTGDPNNGESSVPTPWLTYSLHNGQYLEITNKITYSSMKQSLRSPYVRFWAHTYRQMPNLYLVYVYINIHCSDSAPQAQIPGKVEAMALWATLTLAFSCLLAVAHATTLGVVHTEGGFVQGTNKKIGILFPDYIDIFKGIPFAAQPKTFEKAEKHPGWPGTLKTKDYKPRCVQATIDQSSTIGQEDCLYLNIWVPHSRSGVSTKLPVMVWIYGGGFLLGGGQGANFFNNYLYDGEEIALRGKVIVVTFNYRVGPLGFLSTGDSNAPGNYGMWDQHMAIAWVKRNIAAFGGDVDNITIFGESAGAASVSLQTLTPYNVGLIKRAISQSGVGLCPWAIQRDPLVWAKQIATKVGCPVNDTAELANCLKATDPRAITLAYHLPLTNLQYPLVHYLAFSPVIDGDFIPDEPRNLFGNAADVDYLAGVNNMDGHLFAGVDMPIINQPLQRISKEQVRKLVQGLTLPKGSSGLDIAFDLYTEGWGTNPDQETMKKTIVEAETDYIFLVPTQEALALHRQNAKTAKTYSYLFSHPTRMPVYPNWVGADHAEDLQYMFGKPFSTPLAYRPRDRDVATVMIAYWTNFAKSGDPNNGESSVPTAWLPYSLQNGQYLDITNKITNKSMKQSLRSPFVRFWADTYRQLPQP
ncbi:bile salt-activated lipase [Discoglossus pictus]